MQKFTSEDDLNTFEGWASTRGVDVATTPPEELDPLLRLFEEVKTRSLAKPKVGLMKLQPAPGELRYAVAVREGSDLWLVLWVRRSRKGEFFVMLPRLDQESDVHASYHLDGTRHLKSDHRTVLPSTKLQPLRGTFRGTEQLVSFFGYGPKSVGAICDPAAFSRVVEVPPGILGPFDGGITVELVQPGCDPAAFPWAKIALREVIRDIPPWIIITIGSCG